jgi:hypothetical protein
VRKKKNQKGKRGTNTLRSKKDNPLKNKYRKTPSTAIIGNPIGYLQGTR